MLMNAKDEIIRLSHQQSAARVGRDVPAMDAMLSDDFLYTNSLGKVAGKADYLRRMSDPNVVWKRQDLQVEDVRVVGDTAVLIGTVHDEAMFGTIIVDETYRTTRVYARTADGWTCVAGHTSSISSDRA